MTILEEESGFTLIEMILAVLLASILVVIYAQFIGGSLFYYNRDFTKTTLQTNTKLAVESIARDIRQAQRIEDTNAQPDNNAPGAPSNLYSWQSTSGSNATLVLAMPARDSSGNLIYLDPQTHNNPCLDDVVYYLDSSSKILYRRTISAVNQSGCGTDAAVTTCPESLASPSCPADSKVVENVANLTTAYFDTNNQPTTPANLTYSVQITLTQTTSAGGTSYQSSYTTTVTLRNK